MIANGKHDRVERNHISHESPQSGQGGGRASVLESHIKIMMEVELAP